MLDVYDIHWYSEATAGGTRVTNLTDSSLTDPQIQTIVQSPRSLRDPTYREASWIADYLGGPVRILDRLQTKIDADWPGTGLAVTEYANGGDNHIAGAVATADSLGIFASRRVFAATYWPLTSDCPFILAGFKMYRDYDGSLATFGNVSIPTVSSDMSKVAACVSQDTHTADRYVLVAVNRSNASQDVGFRGLAPSGAARIYRPAGTSPAPVLVGRVPADLASGVVTLPALSVSTIELTASAAARVAADFSGNGNADILLRNTGTSEIVRWLNDGIRVAATRSLGTVSTDWRIAAVGDDNSVDQTDIPWVGAIAGDVVACFMEGSAIALCLSLEGVSTDWPVAD